MRYKIFVICLFWILMTCSVLTGQERPVDFIPEKPKANGNIMIKFDAENTKLKAAKSMKVLISSIVMDTVSSHEYLMTKSGDVWEYKYSIPQSSWSIGVKFTDGKAEVDDDGFYFPVFLYDENGNLLKGTRASYASSCLSSLVFTSQPGTSKAYPLFKKEFEENPELAKYFLTKYVYSLTQEKPDGWKEKIKNTLESLPVDGEDLNEKVLHELEYTYRYIVKDKGKAEEYKRKAIAKYPLGIAAQSEAYDEIEQIKPGNVEELKNAVKAYNTKFGIRTMHTSTLWQDLIDAYCENKMYAELKELLIENKNVLQVLSIMNSISSEARKIAEDNSDLEFAKYLVDYSVDISNNYQLSVSEFKGDSETQRTFKINGYKSRTLFDAGVVYEKSGDTVKALSFIEEAYSYGDYNDNVKIMYAKLLVELNRNIDKALTITADLITESKVTNEITELNKESYVLLNGSDEGYTQYFNELRKPLLSERRNKIKAELINEPAADFSLTDHDGNTVTLSEFKGKIVVLDFWASWCIPCKASMPLMKDAVEKYADDEDVEFFFVDTFERGKDTDIKESARKFMAENNYPFHVLFDTDGKVAKEGYGITMIPAKAFIDKEGNLRFTSMGFNKSELLDEIDIIIDLLK